MINSKQRAYLRSISNNIDAVFQIGKNGVTPELTEGINEYLEVHEIIKLSVLNSCSEDINDISQILSERTRSNIVNVIGKKIVLFRQSKDKPKIILPKA